MVLMMNNKNETIVEELIRHCVDGPDEYMLGRIIDGPELVWMSRKRVLEETVAVGRFISKKFRVLKRSPIDFNRIIKDNTKNIMEHIIENVSNTKNLLYNDNIVDKTCFKKCDNNNTYSNYNINNDSIDIANHSINKNTSNVNNYSTNINNINSNTNNNDSTNNNNDNINSMNNNNINSNSISDQYSYLDNPIGNVVGFFCKNSCEQIISELALNISGMISCPIHSSYGKSMLSFILDHADMNVCFMSYDMLQLYINSNIINRLHSIILLDTIEVEEESVVLYCNNNNISVYYYNDIIHEYYIDIYNLKLYQGINNEYTDKYDVLYNIISNMIGPFPLPSDVSLLCYTSGTTSTPKGVLLSYTNMINVKYCLNNSSIIQLSSDDIHLSYLPHAHVLEKSVLIGIITKGAKIVPYRGNIKNILSFINIVRPTILIGVPLVYEGFKRRIIEAVNNKPWYIRLIFKGASWIRIQLNKIGYGYSYIYNNNNIDNSNSKYKNNTILSFIFNKIFGDVSNSFGGRIRACLSGGAYLSPSTGYFIQSVLGCKVMQGYGQTETAACCMIRPIMINSMDSVGIPLSNTTAMIHNNELLLKGDCVFLGYHKDSKLTRESFFDGYLRTGDMAKCINGLYYIMDRTKDYIKLSNGEYIGLERLENMYRTDNTEDIILILTDNRVKCILFICLYDNTDKEEEKKKVGTRINDLYRDGIIVNYEIPKDIIVIDSFSKYEDVYTPTGKKKRKVLEEYIRKEYRNIIEEIQ